MNPRKPATRRRIAREQARRALDAAASRFELADDPTPELQRLIDRAQEVCDRRPPPELPALLFITEDETGEIELYAHGLAGALASLRRKDSGALDAIVAADQAREELGCDVVVMASSRRSGAACVAVLRLLAPSDEGPRINVWAGARGLS